MNFGIFSEHPLPRPWNEDSEYRLLQDSLDQIELRTICGSLERKMAAKEAAKAAMGGGA